MTTMAHPDQAIRTALMLQDRPRRANAWSAAVTFGWRAVLKIKHTPEQMSDVLGIPIIFTLLFTYLFGGALSGSPHDYLQFLLPGSLVMAILMVSTYTGVGLSTDMTAGVFDRFRSLPIWRPAPIVGAMLGDIGRYLIASALVVGLGLAIGYRPAGGVTGTIAAVALLLVFAFGLGWIWSTLGLLLRTPRSVMSIGMLILFPLTFASNVFVEPHTLPGWLRAFVDVNPISHLVTAERNLMLGTATVGQVVWVLIAAAALTVIFAPVTSLIYRNKNI